MMDRLISCSREYQRSSTDKSFHPVRGLIILIGVEDPRSGLIIRLRSPLRGKVSWIILTSIPVYRQSNFYFLVSHFFKQIFKQIFDQFNLIFFLDLTLGLNFCASLTSKEFWKVLIKRRMFKFVIIKLLRKSRGYMSFI